MNKQVENPNPTENQTENLNQNPYQNLEKKWTKYWLENKVHKAYNPSDEGFDEQKPKKYILAEFPFPSGASLHVGHCFRYTLPDVYSRFLRMTGHNVLFPIGWDAFGLPAEEYARKTGADPAQTTKQNIENLKADLLMMGYGFDWDRELATTDPEYYKWTQWIFGEFWKNGLATQQEVELWWCPALGTVLANEEVLDDGKGGKESEKGGHSVIKKKMLQWVLKMPEYAEELLEGLEQTEFGEHIKGMQKNWIGKSEGVVVEWEVVNSNQ